MAVFGRSFPKKKKLYMKLKNEMEKKNLKTKWK